MFVQMVADTVSRGMFLRMKSCVSSEVQRQRVNHTGG